MWQRGDQIVVRFGTRERIWRVIPVTVVDDSPEMIALYVAMDTPIKWPIGLDSQPIPRRLPYPERVAIPWRLGDDIWRGSSVLWLSPPGHAYAVGVYWLGAERTFGGWYVNLQLALQRTPVGFDSADQLLDITVAPDGTWRWKDEDEFADAQELGRISPHEAHLIRAQGEAVIPLIEQRVWPFQPMWDSWRPDPSWGIPGFPANWDSLEPV